MSKRTDKDMNAGPEDDRLRDDAQATLPAAGFSEDPRATQVEEHADRDMDDRAITGDHELTDLELSAMFNQSFYQDALPDIPNIPGYHVCWLTTTNSRDTVPMRMRLGYTPVTLSDIPGWEHTTLKSGEYAGYIGVNEMLAFKIPLKLYNRIMQEYHHWAPLREQEKILGTVDSLKGQAQSVGGKVEEGDGISDLRKSVPVPSFI